MRSEPRVPRVHPLLWLAVRAIIALILARGALIFLLHGKTEFARLERPDSARWFLGLAEILGAALFLFSRTLMAGALLLVTTLAWAAGFHFALALPSSSLWVFLLIVLSLFAASRWEASRRSA
ncbi:MAG TPA: hypothetical protein VLO07_08290 [Thermoanaerobaculia bacterium]|nr:hypothetical protein [Thermoanaerobaculia bacterium]